MKHWILMAAVLASLLGCDQSNLEALANGGYSVSYDANTANSGQVPTSSKVYRPGSTFIVPGNLGNLAKTGHTLAGWSITPSGSAKVFVAGATFEVTGSVTLYARWLPNTYTVSFNSQGGTTVASESALYGSKVQTPSQPILSGSGFGGWYREAQATTSWNFNSDTVAGDLTLFAKWVSNGFVVGFNSLGGSPVESLAVSSGGLLVRPADPTLSGQAFAGWYREPALTNAWNFAQDTVTANLTLYAKWAVAKTFTENAPTSLNLKSLPVDVSGTTLTHYYNFAGPAAYGADMTKSYPLVVSLHAWGQSNDPAKLGNGSPGTYTEILQSLSPSATNPAFIYVPVCPPPYKNANEPEAPDGGEWNSPAAKAMVIAGILDLQNRFNIDPKRIYLVGFSMGGAGGWYIGDAWYQSTGKPFAAVVRGSGWWLTASREPNLAGIQASMSTMSTWTHVGSLDTNGQIKWSPLDIAKENFASFKALYSDGEDPPTVRPLDYVANGTSIVVQTDYSRLTLKSGKEHRLSVYREQGHNKDLLFLDPAVIPWMFAQHLP